MTDDIAGASALPPKITPADFAAANGTGDWRYVLGAVRADFRFGSYAEAAAFIPVVAGVAEAIDHHPDVDLRYPNRLRFSVTTHDVGSLSTKDVQLATIISRLARTQGAEAEPLAAQVVEIAIDTMDPDRIRPFWAAVLDYDDKDGDLVDPHRMGPPVWFQTMDEPRPQRDRFHLDVSVPHDVAEARIAAALAAGGTLVSDSRAPLWLILADADGNEACVCTWQGR